MADPRELPHQELLKDTFKNILRGTLDPNDVPQSTYIGKESLPDGRPSKKTSLTILVKAEDVGLAKILSSDLKTDKFKPLKLYAVTPPTSTLSSDETVNTCYLVLDSDDYSNNGAKVRRKWILLNDGTVQSFEKRDDLQHQGQKKEFHQIKNDETNNLDLWTKVQKAVWKPKTPRVEK